MFIPAVITNTSLFNFIVMRSTGHKGGLAGANKREINQHPGSKSSEIKTDPPLSEKDEVKQAETRLRKSVKKHG
jgi:hypothetical protein